MVKRRPQFNFDSAEYVGIADGCYICLHLGRTPIVMTKRKDHAALLYDMLRGEAKHTFLLQGGGGLKERKHPIKDNLYY